MRSKADKDGWEIRHKKEDIARSTVRCMKETATQVNIGSGVCRESRGCLVRFSRLSASSTARCRSDRRIALFRSISELGSNRVLKSRWTMECARFNCICRRSRLIQANVSSITSGMTCQTTGINVNGSNTRSASPLSRSLPGNDAMETD